MKFLALSMMLVVGLNPDVSTTRNYTGRASSLNERKHIYAEEHQEVYEKGKRVRLNTTYRNELNNVIATRTSDFSRHEFMPDFRLENRLTGYMEGAEKVDGGVRLFVRNATGEPISEKTVKIPQPAVLDAGFNSFVQVHWDSLITGRKLLVNFGVPSRLDYYSFRLYKDGETRIDGRRVLIVKFDVDNFVLRFLVDPIILKYDTETKRMISYEGISNLSDGKGKNYVVKIDFGTDGP